MCVSTLCNNLLKMQRAAQNNPGDPLVRARYANSRFPGLDVGFFSTFYETLRVLIIIL